MLPESWILQAATSVLAQVPIDVNNSKTQPEEYQWDSVGFRPYEIKAIMADKDLHNKAVQELVRRQNELAQHKQTNSRRYWIKGEATVNFISIIHHYFGLQCFILFMYLFM